MSLHDRIMELPTQDRHFEGWSNTRIAWLAGFDTGLHEASKIAKEADELMAEMARALRAFSHYPKIGKLCEEYDNWKETTK